MRLIMRLIRWPIGQLILLLDYLTSPSPPQRDPAEQARLDEQTSKLALYQFVTCPFCVKTRRALRRFGLNIELRDAQNDPRWRQQLLDDGGRLQVPCLYIPGIDGDDRWLYESNDIIAYLEGRFLDKKATATP